MELIFDFTNLGNNKLFILCCSDLNKVLPRRNLTNGREIASFDEIVKASYFLEGTKSNTLLKC